MFKNIQTILDKVVEKQTSKDFLEYTMTHK